MISKKMENMVANSSAIRAMFEEGNRVANQKRHIYRDRFDHVVVDRTQPDQ